MNSCLLRSILALVLMLCPMAAGAQGAPLDKDPVHIVFVDGGDGYVGLDVSLLPGWKFYWRTPGEGGVPPSFDWNGSRNLERVEVFWPTPRRIAVGDVDLFGYTDKVVLPIAFTPRQADMAVDLSLRIEYGVCREICILREDHLRYEATAHQKADPGRAARLELWKRRVPKQASEAGIRLVSRQSEGGQVTLVIASDVPLNSPDLLVEGAADGWFGRPAVLLSSNHREARFNLPVSPAAAAKGPLVLTLVDGPRAAELKVAGQ